ncbi:MAG: hypothetical protein RL654_3022 [Pseudomonadota bacterium]
MQRGQAIVQPELDPMCKEPQALNSAAPVGQTRGETSVLESYPIMTNDLVLQSWNPTDPGEAQALISAVIARARTEGVELCVPPAEPDNCCGNGCIGCVWDGFYSELGYWRDEALLRWAT